MNEFVATSAARLDAAVRVPRSVTGRLLLTALAICSIALFVLQLVGIEPVSQPPFTLDRAASGAYVLRQRSNQPLPPSLRDGDVVVMSAMTRADRAALLSIASSISSVPPGTRMELAVIHEDRTVRVPVVTTAARVAGTADLIERIDGALTMLFVFGLALLTLWRARDGAGLGLAVFSLSILFSNALQQLSVPPPVGIWLIEISLALQALVALPALYVTAETLATTGLSAQWVRVSRSVVSALAAILTAASVGSVLLNVYLGRTTPRLLDVGGELVLGLLVALPAVVLIKGYRDGAHESRLRIRWILWSTALLFAAVVALNTLSSTREPVLYQVAYLSQGVALLGYLYAVLRSRIVDVSFVVDRALVFGLITAFIFGVFSLLEQAMHRFAAGDNFGWALQAAVALALAMALSPVHHRLERAIEKIFFGSQLRAIASLRRFAAECAFVERTERLLSLAIERILVCSASAAVYERTPSGYAIRATHDASWPQLIDVDDPIFVSLRTGAKEVDLAELRNGVGTEGFAFPMSVAEALAGAIICRPRDGEQLAPDVRSALAEVAHHVAMSLYILRNREQARLVADIAAERVDDSTARSRAMALMQGAT